MSSAPADRIALAQEAFDLAAVLEHQRADAERGRNRAPRTTRTAASSISQISTSIAPGPVPSNTSPGFGGLVPGKHKGGIPTAVRDVSAKDRIALGELAVERLARQMRADDRNLNGLLLSPGVRRPASCRRAPFA